MRIVIEPKRKKMWIYFWTCNYKDHRHQTYSAAEKCIRSFCYDRKRKIEKKEREIFILDLTKKFLNEENYTKIAGEIKRSPTQVRNVIRNSLRNIFYKMKIIKSRYDDINFEKIIHEKKVDLINFINSEKRRKKKTKKIEEIKKDIPPHVLSKAEELKNLNLESFDFSVRVLNAMKNIDVENIGQLMLKGEKDLLQAKNFGRKSLREIKEILREMNIEWPIV